MNDLLIFASLYYGPKHGYLIKKEAGLILGGGELHNNLVYPLLHRFARRGWVGKKKSGGERGQTRLEYFLTPAGKAEMLRRLACYSGRETSDDAFYLRAGLFDLLPAAARLRILSARRRQLEEMSARIERIAAELEPPDSAARVLSFLERKTKFELDWVRSLGSVAAMSSSPQDKRRAAGGDTGATTAMSSSPQDKRRAAGEDTGATTAAGEDTGATTAMSSSPQDKRGAAGEDTGATTAMSSSPQESTPVRTSALQIAKRTRKPRLRRLDRLFTNYPVYFLTACAAGRQPILNNEPAHQAFRAYADASVRHGVVVGRYVLMPNHIHLFAAFSPEAPTLSVWMKGLKRAVIENLRNAGGGGRWQKGFFDHVMRSEESYEQKWLYVRENPVRARLVRRWEQWPFQGEAHPLAVRPL